MVISHQRSERSSGATDTPSVTDPVGLDEVVSMGARRVAATLAASGTARSRDEWLGVVGDCQALINTLTAVQDAAIAEAARREGVWCEDGTLGEAVHAPGRVALDAADLLAPVIGASHPQAQRRVEQAVRFAAGRVPVPAEHREVPQASGLGGLHRAMATGQLDGYRAGVVAHELDVAPADVADAIVAALEHRFGDDATTLRRRTRVLLERISPDLVRERAKRARAATGLRRWVAEPGVDEWHGTFPSEDAAAAWAAIDKLAHDLVATGTCTNVEQARGKALTDLVTGNATIDVQVRLTVPATAATTATTTRPDRPTSGTAADSTPAVDHVEPPASTGEGHEVPTTVVGRTRGATVVDSAERTTTSVEDQTRPETRHASSPTSAPGQRGMVTPGDATSTSVTDHARPRPADEPSSANAPVMDDLPKATADSGAREPDDDDDDLIEVQGARPSEPLLVRRGWLRDHLPKGSPGLPTREQPRSPVVPCDPLTGARLDPGDHLTTDRYRPGASSPPSSAPATAAAASPAARSPPGSATSTTSDPGPPAPPRHPTCSPSAGATTASSKHPAGACAWPPTAPPRGPTPQHEYAPPRPWTP